VRDSLHHEIEHKANVYNKTVLGDSNVFLIQVKILFLVLNNGPQYQVFSTQLGRTTTIITTMCIFIFQLQTNVWSKMKFTKVLKLFLL